MVLKQNKWWRLVTGNGNEVSKIGNENQVEVKIEALSFSGEGWCALEFYVRVWKQSF